MTEQRKDLTGLDQLVLSSYPYPIAIAYRKALEAPDWEKKIEWALKTFEYGLRTLTLSILSQYLNRDQDQVDDPELNALLYENLSRGATLGTWKRIFFTCIEAYGNRRDLFFMTELYDLYWNSKYRPHRKHSNFGKIVR